MYYSVPIKELLEICALLSFTFPKRQILWDKGVEQKQKLYTLVWVANKGSVHVYIIYLD